MANNQSAKNPYLRDNILCMKAYFYLCGPGHQFFNPGMDFTRFRNLFVFFPISNTLPGCDDNVILRVIPRSQHLTRDITFRENCSQSQFPKEFSKIRFLSLFYLTVDNNSSGVYSLSSIRCESPEQDESGPRLSCHFFCRITVQVPFVFGQNLSFYLF